MQGTKPDHGWSWWYLLLLAQFIPALWVPFYNSAEPYWIGLPFFYWSQFAFVPVGVVCVALVFRMTRDEPTVSSAAPAGGVDELDEGTAR